MIEAGAELDHKIAIEIMGWVENEGGIGYTTPDGQRSIELTSFGHFEPSTCIDSAWEVLEHCKLFEQLDCLMMIEDGNYEFRGYRQNSLLPSYYEAGTVPMVICLAALGLKKNG